ncbi:MAG: hypothetical protein ABIO70_09775 [Pseudomonadota bacterium]
MTMPYQVGAPTVEDLGSLERLPSALAYLDWNVMQYLRSRDEAAPLLGQLLEPSTRRALDVPYSYAHLADATAGWPSLSREHRAGRLRTMLFADGVTESLLWEIQHDSSTVRRHPMWREAEARALFDSVDDWRAEAPEQVAAVEEALRMRAETALAQMRANANRREPTSQKIADELMEQVRALGERGLPALAEASSLAMGPLATAMLAFEQLSGEHRARYDAIARAEPDDAVASVDRFMSGLGLGESFDLVLQRSMTEKGLHQDDLGPMMLAVFGYQPEQRRKLRHRPPGFIADITHARFALNAAMFVTGDLRLAMRVEAWAHHTGRGLGHGHGPVVYVVRPDDEESFERVADGLLTLADSIEPAPAAHHPRGLAEGTT